MQIVNRFVRNHLINGRLRATVRPLYRATIRLELQLVRALDARHAPAAGSPLFDDVTAVIKTFERPETLQRLLESIRRSYPTLKIIVADDSRHPREWPDVELVKLPFNSGVSAGKEAAVERVKTKYVLMLDDDFVFYRHTRLEPAVAAMERLQQIDIMGGRVVNLPLFTSNNYRNVSLLSTERKPVQSPGSFVAAYEVYDKVPNFLLARTERIKLVGWDADIKRLDHADFFTRACGRLLTVFNPELRVLHAQTLFDDHYMDFRNDVTLDLALLQRRYGTLLRSEL